MKISKIPIIAAHIFLQLWILLFKFVLSHFYAPNEGQRWVPLLLLCHFKASPFFLFGHRLEIGYFLKYNYHFLSASCFILYFYIDFIFQTGPHFIAHNLNHYFIASVSTSNRHALRSHLRVLSANSSILSNLLMKILTINIKLFSVLWQNKNKNLLVVYHREVFVFIWITTRRFLFLFESSPGAFCFYLNNLINFIHFNLTNFLL